MKTVQNSSTFGPERSLDSSLRLAVLQITPVYLDALATWEKLKSLAHEAIADGADIITWGKSLIPGYPGWISIDTSDKQKHVYARYWEQCVTLDGALVADIRKFAKSNTVMIVAGVGERFAGSTFATTLTIDRDGELIGHHRKIKPTWRERLVWAEGDGSGLQVHPTSIGNIGSLNCWENWLPLARASLHAQEQFLHVGLWPGSQSLVKDITKFIAMEGCVWSVAASGLISADTFASLSEADFPMRDAMMASPMVLQNGGSQIVAPNGSVVAGPLIGEEGIVAADITTRAVVEQRQIMDPSGHYARNDIFDLRVRNGKTTDSC